MNFTIIKGKLKKASHKWQEYLLGKNLILCTGLGEVWNLIEIEENEGMKNFCKYIWKITETEERDYDCLEDLIEEVELGNYGFGFDKDEIEIVESKTTVV